MKQFNNPMMSVVNLTNEDIISASEPCSPDLCNGHGCPDCITCTGGFTCSIFSCSAEKYSGNGVV